MTVHVCPPDHKHAETTTCYTTHRCRCELCIRNATRDRSRRRRLEAYGRPTSPLVDAQPVREHVWDLRLQGMGAGRIAELAGVSKCVVRHILWGSSSSSNRPARRVSAAGAAKILAVPLDPDLNAWLDPRGTQRRLQALAVQGWSFAKLGERLGISYEGVHQMVRSVRVYQSSHARVVALFAELWDQAPPMVTPHDRMVYSRTRRWAASKGWVGPLSWDDIDHDEFPAESVHRRVA